MEIVFNGKTYTKFQKLWNDIHFNRGFDDDNKNCHSVGLIYCRDHVSNLYRMYDEDFQRDGCKLEMVLAIDKDNNFLNSDEVIEYDEKNGCVFQKQPEVDRIMYIYKFPALRF